MVPPGLFVSQRVFDEGGPLQYKAVAAPVRRRRGRDPRDAAGVRMEVGAPATWVVSVMHDITDTEHLERMRDQFFAAAAHSLKTPLAIIKADVQALHAVGGARRSAASPHRSTASAIESTAWSRTCWCWRGRARASAGAAPERDGAAAAHRAHLAREASGRTGTRCATERDRLAVAARRPRAHRPRHPEPAVRGQPAVARRIRCLTLLARPEGDQVAVGVRYQPLPWRDQVEQAYGEYDDIGIGRSVAQTIVEEHGGSLSEEASDSERTSWIHLPGDAGAHA